MRQETVARLTEASGLVGGFKGNPTEGYAEAKAELHLTKMEYRLEQMVIAAPSPLTDEQRERLCAFLAEIP